MITKRNFEEIATILREARRIPCIDLPTLEYIEDRLTSYFKAENPRFDTYRFLKASGRYE